MEVSPLLFCRGQYNICRSVVKVPGQHAVIWSGGNRDGRLCGQLSTPQLFLERQPAMKLKTAKDIFEAIKRDLTTQ